MHAAMAMASKKIDGIDSYTYELFDVLEVKRERSYVFDAISELNNIENVKIEIDPRGHGLTNMVAAIQNQINIMNLSICFVCDWWFVLVFLLLSFMYTWHWQRLCYDFLLSLLLFFLSYFANQLAMLELIDWLKCNWVFGMLSTYTQKRFNELFAGHFKYENSFVFVKFIGLLETVRISWMQRCLEYAAK